MDDMISEFKKINIISETNNISKENLCDFEKIKEIIPGKFITKNKRHEIFGQVGSGSQTMNPEKYQRKKIEEITKHECLKSNTRLNLRKYQLINITYPNIKENGFDFSENFDGIQKIYDKLIYINLKCIVGKGGSQTRSLREVYWFIEGQLNFLLERNLINTQNNIYFANILDGDESYRTNSKFDYLVNIKKFESIKNKIYIGDLQNYFFWINDIF